MASSMASRGTKCEYGLCRQCCRKKANEEIYDCKAHNIKRKTKSEQEKLKHDKKDVISYDGVDSNSPDCCSNLNVDDLTDNVENEQRNKMAKLDGDQRYPDSDSHIAHSHVDQDKIS